MISIRVTTVGDTTPQRLTGMLHAFDRGIQDWTPAWPKVIERFRTQEERRFATENVGGPSGRYAALSPAYARRKAIRYPGAPILTATGRLRASLAASGAGSVIEQSPRRLFMGSTVPYGAYHQAGTSRIPRRPAVDPSSKDVAEFVSEIWRYIESVKVKSGFKGRFVAAMS